MGTVYQLLLIIGFIVAGIFSLIVLFTGKGDAMSGGGSVRTTFKGKASFDDIMSRVAFGFGIAFMIITLLLNTVAARYANEIGLTGTDFKVSDSAAKTSQPDVSKSGEPAPESKSSKP